MSSVCGNAAFDPRVGRGVSHSVNASGQVILAPADLRHGGEWRICYCVNGHCATSPDFSQSAGTLVVRGVAKVQLGNAIAGHGFPLEVFGQGLQATDVVHFVPGSHCAGTGKAAKVLASSSDGFSLNLEAPALSAGPHRACWCGNSTGACSVPFVDVGAVAVAIAPNATNIPPDVVANNTNVTNETVADNNSTLM